MTLTQPANAAPLITIQGISKTFDMGTSKVEALVDINLQIDTGGIMTLMGPSGSGKSTLLNLLGALDTPNQGQIHVAGQDIARLPADERANFRNTSVGFIFQNFNLIPVLTAFENILLPNQLSPTSPVHAERAHELLRRVGLEKQSHQSVNRLSGGQMQRVSIARALINKPKIILADEPTANLDHATAGNILELLAELSRDENTTVIIATHDHAVLKYVQRNIRLHDGKIIEDQIV